MNVNKKLPWGGYLSNTSYNRKGFTLIELLAVIVILAVIALISTPLIMGTIEKAKVNAYKDNIYGILKASENYVAEELLKEDYQGETLDLSSETKLKYKGTKPKEGTLEISKSGSTALFIQNGKYCYIKRRNANDIEVIENAKECSIRVANNLIQNGYGEYGDNTNFSQFQYHDGYFRVSVKGDIRPFVDNSAPINPTKKYHLSVSVRAGETFSPNYLGIREYDADNFEILSSNAMFISGTTTKLAKDLKKGDTIVYLENCNNFYLSDYYIYNGFIIWNYKNKSGYLYPPETYSRNVYQNIFTKTGIDKTNHTITLNKPWAWNDVKAGTELSQSSETATYNYGLLESGTITTDFVKHDVSLSGVTSAGVTSRKFRHGSAAIKFMTLLAYKNPAINTYVDLKEIVLKEVE